MKSAHSAWLGILGIELNTVSHTEKLISALGGFIGIVGVLIISKLSADSASPLIVASMGASAVLLFAVPHGALSQPWPVLGGHTVSALIGVSCAISIPHEMLAAGLAVGLAIGAMHYLRCIHPPGGATALVAVVGGESVHTLGFQFVITPVLLNALTIVTIGILFNYLFTWRRYPAWLGIREQSTAESAAPEEKYCPIEHADLVSALAQVDSFIDITEDDLLRIYELATIQSQQSRLPAEHIRVGHSYSNGLYGNDWSVREILDASPGSGTEKDMVIFKIVAGEGLYSTGVVTRSAFARWARYEVTRDEGNWKRV